MGARPLFGLNIVGFPSNRLPLGVLERILQGAQGGLDRSPVVGIGVERHLGPGRTGRAPRLHRRAVLAAGALAQQPALHAEGQFEIHDARAPAEVARVIAATGYEPVWKDGARVGFVTSGGYGHTVGKSLAMALVDSDVAEEGAELSVHVVGVERGARIIAPSPYDPAGKAMRG